MSTSLRGEAKLLSMHGAALFSVPYYIFNSGECSPRNSVAYSFLSYL
jgi:hypothetical protein